MRKNITNKEYTFSSLQDMYKFLTSDNVDDFLIDFNAMLKDAVAIREEVVSDISNKGLLSMVNVDDILEIDTFSWFDDGKHDETKGSIGIEFNIDPDEGEEEYKNHQM